MSFDVDSDVPDCGAAFTFGRSRFADNVAGKFWIKDDPILQIACGDEHTALLTASGRLFTFGSNEWGQLGHGHTKTLEKPSFVKALKGERATVLACGRSHTLVATASGHVYAFGSNSEGQLGSADEQPIHSSPVRVQGLEGVLIKMLSGGADHSMALTDKGVVYVWGSGSEGQIGPETGHILIPTELNLDCNIICISAGYYHSAFVTVDGKLYTCGEGECGKLGLPDHTLKKTPLSIHCVPGFSRKIVNVSCGGNHTIATTVDGKAYSFGNGYDGQLGLGSQLVDVSTPHEIVFLEEHKIARVSCGENHSAFLTDKGQLYTCGNGRHGKLGLFGVDDCSNQFVPTLVSRFNGFQVQQVTCGGCHTMVLAVRQETVSSLYSNPVESEEVSSARERRRLKSAKVQHISSPSNKHESFSPTLKAEYRQRLPSLSKGAVWYVALQNNTCLEEELNDEEEVITKLEKRPGSFLCEAEKDISIRHVDSDVESDESEVPELNRTHTLIRVDNTILIRPSIQDTSFSSDNQCKNDCEKKENIQDSSGFITYISDFTSHDSKEEKNLKDSTNLQVSTKESESLGKKSQTKSHFYDNETPHIESKSSVQYLTEDKPSKTCAII